MRFIYLIASYNEESILPMLVQKFEEFAKRNIIFEVFVIDNGSTDRSQEILTHAAMTRPWLRPLFIKDKGLGYAFKYGIAALSQGQDLKDTWIVFSAADLPFNFSDLDAFLENKDLNPKSHLFIGSKYHPKSNVKRGLKRIIGSYLFYILRRLILDLKIKDTQGTLILKGDEVLRMKPIAANDYFFTTELIFNFNSRTEIVELPVVYEETTRPSSVRLLRDSLRSIRQLIKLKQQ